MDQDKPPVKFYKKRFFLFFTMLSTLGLVLGALCGFLYYRTAGCTTGSCLITSNPWLCTLWGGAIGYLIGDLLSGRKRSQ